MKLAYLTHAVWVATTANLAWIVVVVHDICTLYKAKYFKVGVWRCTHYVPAFGNQLDKVIQLTGLY